MSAANQPGPARTCNRARLLQKRGLPDLPEARERLIQHLRAIGAGSEPVLKAMAEVPRHAFAPPALWRMAYADTELWGPTAFLPQPSAVAKIATAIQESGARKVLEYATGTGYMTSVLALLADRVDTVEHDPWQLWLSSDAFRELELSNISQKASDGRLGWPERAPFDGIVIAAAVPKILPSFLAQLTDTGVLVAPVGGYYGPHRLLRAQKTSQGTTVTDLGQCFFPPLTGVWTPMDIATDEHATGLQAPLMDFWGTNIQPAAAAEGPVEGFASGAADAATVVG
jgi:protein-L-isoaspartate(D-aspartate) O-methyltransferase